MYRIVDTWWAARINWRMERVKGKNYKKKDRFTRRLVMGTNDINEKVHVTEKSGGFQPAVLGVSYWEKNEKTIFDQ